MSALAILLLAQTASAQDVRLPRGREVEQAVHFDLTRYALTPDKIDAIIQSFVPAELEVEKLMGAGLDESGDIGSNLLGLHYEISANNLIVYPTVDSATITPRPGAVCREGSPPLYWNGSLDVALAARAGLNSPQNPGRIRVRATAKLLGFINFDLINDTCNIHMRPEPIDVGLRLDLGTPRDDNDMPFNDDGLPDPLPSNPPSFCPYTEAGWASATKAAGYQDACMPISVDLRDFEWRFAPNVRDIDLNCGWFLDFIVSLAQGLLPRTVLEDTLASAIDPVIEDALADVRESLTETIDGLFKPENGWRFKLDEPIDLLGAQLEAEVCPRELMIDDRGLRVRLAGRVTAGDHPHPCIAPYDPGGSRRTVPPTRPIYSDLGNYYAPGRGVVEHLPQVPPPLNPPEIVLGVDDDFVNQALYGVWYGGALCQTIDQYSDFELPAGLALDTTLLDLISQSAYRDLFPTPKPIRIETRPRKPPYLATTPLSLTRVAEIHLDEMGVDLYGELEGRMARVVGMEVNAGVGVDVDFLAGSLVGNVDVDTAALAPKIVFNDLRPDASAQIEAGLAGLLDTLVGPLLGDLLGGLSFDLPTFAGLGLQAVDVETSGPGGDFLSVFGEFGFVDYAPPGAGGCDAFDGGLGGGGMGCDGGTSGCDGGTSGCSNAPLSSRLVLLSLPFVVALLRRRRR